MRTISLLLTITLPTLLFVNRHPRTSAAPASIPLPEIHIPDFGLPPVVTEKVEEVLGSLFDTLHTLNNGVASPESDQTDWSCKLTEEHPYPVIMLHGLFAPGFTSWRFMAKRLSESGYCVYQLKYGMIPGFGTLGGLSDMRESAKELDAFIQKVLTATATTNASSASTQKVDIVAHSEGAAVARYYLKFFDRQTKQEQHQQQQEQEQEQGQEQEQQEEEEESLQERPGRVRSLVSIAPVGKGTSVLGLLAMTQILGIYDFLADTIQQYCVACVQVLEGSDFMQELYGDDGLQAEVPGVRYLNVITNRDRAVTPFTNGVMDIPELSKSKGVNGATKTEVEAPPVLQNLVLENHCDSNPDQSDHCGIFQSPFALYATYAFLASDSGTIDTNIPCTFSTDEA